jgi:hypothetical protein
MSTSHLDTKIVPAGDRFDIDVPNSSGLSLRVRGGYYIHQLGVRSAPNATLTLTASETNFVEVNDAGVISTNTTSFTASYTPLYVVTTGATLITGIEDRRGGARAFTVQAMTADGAISETADFVTLSKSGILAATIAAPRAGRWLVIQQIDAGTDGHTVTLSAGTFNETNTIATFNADNEMLVLYGVSATRFVVVENIGSVAFSGS